MNEIKEWVIENWFLFALGGAVLLSTAAAGLTARRLIKGREPLTVLNVITNLVALGFNAEGMFFVIRDKMSEVPAPLAWGGFAVFELFQVQMMILATRKYRSEKTPGKFAPLVWVIALSAASVVSLNATQDVEKIFRIVLPALVVLIWHVSLTADGVTDSRWVFSHWWESKLAHYGLKVGKAKTEGGVNYDDIVKQRRIATLVTLSDKVQEAGRLGGWRVRRLNRLVRNTPAEDLDAVIKQIEVAKLARVRLGLEPGTRVPGSAGTPGTDLVPGGTGTAGTRVQVRDLDLGTSSGTAGAGTPTGTGTDDDTGSEPPTARYDRLRAEAIIRHMDKNETTSFPPTRKLREICASPGNRMSSQDVAVRARDLALTILMERENARVQEEQRAASEADSSDS